MSLYKNTQSLHTINGVPPRTHSPMAVSGQSVEALWVRALSLVLDDRYSLESAPRGKRIKELTPFTMVLGDPRRNILLIPERKLNYHFMVAEWLWILMGYDDVEMISHYNKRISDFSDDGNTFYGAYGPRFREQIRSVLTRLKGDRDTRQAVWTTWLPLADTKDQPCTVSTQYAIRKDTLRAYVTMRSSDLWLGLPYDVFNFTMLQRAVANYLGVKPGMMVLNFGSSHLYEEHWDAAAQIVDKYTNDLYLDNTPPSDEPIDLLLSDSNFYDLTQFELKARRYGIVDECAPTEWQTWLAALASRTRVLEGKPPVNRNDFLSSLITARWRVKHGVSS